MIFLIDFPGFGTGNIFEKKEIYNKVMSICNSFVFVVKNSVIKENSSQIKLKSIFEQAQIQKKKFANEFIKSCLFILNNELEQKTTEDELNIAKEDIKTIINNIDDVNNIKLCFFNAKFYENYIYNYNYFYSLDNLINIEYENYKYSKTSFYRKPFSIKKSEDKSFLDYFYNSLIKKIKSLYDIKNLKKHLKSQIINENIKEKTSKILDETIKNDNLNKENNLEIEDKILKAISYGQNRITELSTLKDSNIDKFKEILESQINYINNMKQNELVSEMDNVINLLDIFFRRDFKERKKDLNQISNLEKEVKRIKKYINSLLELNENSINKIKSEYREKISNSLKKNKSELKLKLELKDYNHILEEINNEIFSNLKGLNNDISKYLKNNELESLEFIKIAKNIIKDFSLDYNIYNFFNFNLYMSKALGDGKKDLEKQVLNELKSSCESSKNILFKKGIIEFFNSLFSDLKYLENIIDILIDTSLKKINFIFELINEESKNYLNKILHKIILLAKIATLEFDDDQQKKWKMLCNLYEETRKKIINTKSLIIKILN